MLTTSIPDVPLRAFIYDRNSRVINGRITSTQDQRVENQRLCERNGWVITGEFCDAGRSASRYARQVREDYERMLDGIRAGGCDVLVVWEPSRVSRSVESFVDLRNLLEQKQVLLCTNGRTHDLSNRSDRFMTLLDAARAEDEADAIRDRNLRTTRLNAERGGVHGRIGYGYRRVYDENTGELVEQVPDELRGAAVMEAIERVAGGQALKSIIRDYKLRGLPAPTGGWSEETLRKIVLRASNIGLREHHGVVVAEGVWEPIAKSEEQVTAYYTAVRILGDPARRTQHDVAVKHLLSGIAKCGPCRAEGAVSPLRRWKQPRENDREVYTCEVCHRVSIALPLLEGFVQASVLTYVARPKFAEALATPAGVGVAAALAKARALEQQLTDARKLASTFEGGKFKLSAASLAGMEGALVPQIAAARALAQDATVPLVLRRLATPDAPEVWKGMELPERRSALRAVVSITVNRIGKGRRGLVPGRIELDWLR